MLMIESAHILLTMALPLLGELHRYCIPLGSTYHHFFGISTGRTGSVAPPDPIAAAIIALFVTIGSGLLSPPYHACTACKASMESNGSSKSSAGLRFLVLPAFRPPAKGSVDRINSTSQIATALAAVTLLAVLCALPRATYTKASPKVC
jgi:hypothetical protein